MLNAGLVGVSILLIVFLGVQALKGVAEYKQIGRAPAERDTITITGEGEVSAAPDVAQIDIGLFTEGSDVPQIQQANAAKVNAIIAAMKGLGIAEADMQTSNYSISPRYQYDEGKQTIIGYTVSQNLSVKVRDLSRIGSVLAKAGELGANQVSGVTFTIDDPSELEQQARIEALAEARRKADQLAAALGVRIVRVVSFSESSGGLPPPIPIARGLEAADAVAPDIRPGSLDVTSQVSVTFEIR